MPYARPLCAPRNDARWCAGPSRPLTLPRAPAAPSKLLVPFPLPRQAALPPPRARACAPSWRRAQPQLAGRKTA
eukprot:6194772-Pleurochrysis_carterae.AAC.1